MSNSARISDLRVTTEKGMCIEVVLSCGHEIRIQLSKQDLASALRGIEEYENGISVGDYVTFDNSNLGGPNLLPRRARALKLLHKPPFKVIGVDEIEETIYLEGFREPFGSGNFVKSVGHNI